MRTAAVIPVFNNDRTVGDIIRETQKHVDMVIVVNDGSTDGTSIILKGLAKRDYCTILTHPENRGKGEALKSAIKHLKSNAAGLDAVVFLDADKEHDPEEIPHFLRMLGIADIVIGMRASYRDRKRRLLNRWMMFWFRLINPRISDPSCGFRAVRWEVLKKLELHSSDFCIDAEIVLEAIKAGASIISVNVSLPKHAVSSVTRTDFIRINNFFDDWVLRNARHLRLSPPRRVTLVAGASVGKTMGTLLAKWMKQRN